MHWLVVLAIVLVLFGAGKLPSVMGDFAKVIKAFKAGMKEEDEPETTAPGAAATAATTSQPQVVSPPGATVHAVGERRERERA